MKAVVNELTCQFINEVPASSYSASTSIEINWGKRRRVNGHGIEACLSKDVITHIFSFLEVEDVMSSMCVCTAFYTASKNNSLWTVLLAKRLPAISVLKDTPFSPEQQARIVFHRIIEVKNALRKENATQEALFQSGLVTLKGFEFLEYALSVSRALCLPREKAISKVPDFYNNQVEFVKLVRAAEEQNKK